MRKNFESSLAQVLTHEGGYVDHPRDPGGATNRGITLKVFRNFYGGHLGKADLRQITEREAGAIYKTNYWDKCQCDKLPAGVDYAVFDQAVNSGPGRSIKWLQVATGAEVDGGMGPNTLAAAKSMEPVKVITKMCNTRLSFLKGLQTWDVFGQGWQNRVTGVRKQATSLANGDKPTVPHTQEASFEVVKKGSKGPWVKKLQSALNRVAEASEPALKADGKFGPSTRSALISFQRQAGLDADGVAGYNTYQALGLIG